MLFPVGNYRKNPHIVTQVSSCYCGLSFNFLFTFVLNSQRSLSKQSLPDKASPSLEKKP